MIEVINGGLLTTVQDYPGRTGYWSIGLPPSGPMDPLAFQIANKLVGNPEGEAALEMTIMGGMYRFQAPMTIALTGAKMAGTLNGGEVPWYTPVSVKAGDELSLQAVSGAGFRSYLAVAGGIDVPEYLGSKATFAMGGFGGYEGRKLRAGDLLKVGKPRASSQKAIRKSCRLTVVPEYGNEWEIGVLEGPHGAPEFFTKEDVDMFYSTAWKMNYNSNRLGCRLDGPAPSFARKDGGVGGQHPSNMVDYPYSIGMIDFTGDMPVILTADGPSMGGFISMMTIAEAELWKVGQAKPGDVIYFVKLDYDEALALKREQKEWIRLL